MMRRYLLLVFTLLVSLPLQANLKVFTCEPEWAALAEELGGNHVDVTSATQAMQDPHYIQARPSLIAQIRKADLLVCTGAGLEAGWLPVLLRKGNNPRILAGKPGHLMATSHVTMKEVPQVVDRSMGDIHASGNPHIQTDPRNIAKVATVLTDRLIQIDSANRDEYQRRYEDFSLRWNTAIKDWQQKAASVKGMPVVVYHRSWIYLQDWLGLKEVASLEPKPGIPPGSRYLADVLNRTQGFTDLVIIHSQYQESKAIEWFSRKSGAPVVLLPSTVGGTAEAEDLFSWYEEIIRRLLKPHGGGNE
ncbi:MAG: zinc ABC transporter substrate-binding protein [Pseudomonadota bacterium]|nr:zinc ABC transporter substrate-binding protein [Pseudomonadota bacterium]